MKIIHNQMVKEKGLGRIEVVNDSGKAVRYSENSMSKLGLLCISYSVMFV